MRVFLCVFLFFCISSMSLAHNKVVVIPMAGDDAVPIKNIITVGLENADFSNPINALESIADATRLEPYLVFIGPGTYTLGKALFIPTNVHVVGSGIGVTILEAGFGHATDVAQSAVVSMRGGGSQSAASLRDLSVYQYGFSNGISTGVYAVSQVDISNVDVRVTSSGTVNYGIYFQQTSAKLKDSLVETNNASLFTASIYMNNGTNILAGTSIKAQSGIFVAGIYNLNARLTSRNVDAIARWELGTNSIWGFYGRSDSISSFTDAYYSSFTLSGVSSQEAVPNSAGCFLDTVGTNSFDYTRLTFGCQSSRNNIARCLYSNNSVAEFEVDCVGLR